MPALCNNCQSPIPADDINVQADTVLCRACGTATAYSALIHAPTAGLLSAPPPGCHVEELGGTWRAVASTRTVKVLPLAALALVWCGFTLFAIAMALLGPGSGPRPGPTIATLPFLSFHALFGGYLLWQAACGIVGDVRAVIDATTVRVGAGIGPLRRWRSRPLADVREVRTDRSPARGYWRTWLYRSDHHLVLAGPDPLRFGDMLTDQRRQFLHAAIAA